MHATFPCIIAATMAPLGEREGLISMCQSGDFYGQMATLLGVADWERLKQSFQREAVFSFRPRWAAIWIAFRREFPGTARRTAEIRDRDETVVADHVKSDVNGRQFTARTCWGQRRLSRILSRCESRIFLPTALAFVGDYAVVTLSKPRDSRFQGLELDERLSSRRIDPECGLQVIDLNTGAIAHWLRLDGSLVTELYDVVVLPGVRQPTAIGFQTDEIERLLLVGEDDKL